jgi:serine/threonine protein kinase
MISQVDDYKLGRKLGAGCFADVFESLHPKTGQPVVVKVIKPEVWAQSEAVRENVRQEFSLQSEINHVNCLEVLSFSDKGRTEAEPDRQVCYAVLEPCTGGELFDEIV